MTHLQLLYTVNDESNVIPQIIYEHGDELVHTAEHPYCTDPTCPCGGSLTTNETEEAEENTQEEIA